MPVPIPTVQHLAIVEDDRFKLSRPFRVVVYSFPAARPRQSPIHVSRIAEGHQTGKKRHRWK
jgi:hypothetical protein